MGADVCWICGRPSETGEHRIKKSDLVERFGKGPYRGDGALVHVKEGRVRDVQGPDSKLVKYEKNLCSYCNNTLTQPFDKAYEEFIPWVMQNEAEVLKRRVIDFESMYGSNWANKRHLPSQRGPTASGRGGSGYRHATPVRPQEALHRGCRLPVRQPLPLAHHDVLVQPLPA